MGTVTTTGVGLSGLFGTVAAEDVDRDELARLSAEPNVRMVLDELDIETLPGPEHVEKRRIGDDSGLVMMKVGFQYGTLVVAENADQVGAMFTFAEDRTGAPQPYRELPATDASLIGTDDGIIFRRLATETETELAVGAVDPDEDVTQTNVYTGSDIDGFRVDIRIDNNGLQSDDEVDRETATETRSYRVYGSILKEFDPKNRAVPESRSIESTTAFSTEQIETDDDDVQTQATSTIRRIIIDWAEGWLARELSALLGPCGPACTGCADWVVSLALDCRTCRPICSTGLNPKGAIVCVLCVYAFCNDALDMIDCSRCAACLVEGEAPDDPRDDIWDALPSPPSLWPF